MAKSFQDENDELLQFILEKAFYNIWTGEHPDTMEALELNITPVCNQKCSYCYVVQHRDEIYPKEIRDNKTIIRNLKLLVDYFIKNNWHPNRIDMFSGEIWGTKLANDVLDVIYNAVKNHGWRVNYIMIPSNMSFLLNEAKRKTIENYIEKFKHIGVDFDFSASVDGIYLETENRPFVVEKNSTIKDSQSWYDFLFSWCKEQSYAFHPMIAANGVEKWKDNYIWWHNMFKKFKMDPYLFGMYLEVRNDDWTLERIHAYLDVLNFMIDTDYEKLCNSNNEFFVIENIPVSNGGQNKGYFPYVLLDEGKGWGCGIDKMLTVRLGDLAIGPCHRTSYKQFLFGKYRLNDSNSEIIGVEGYNVQLANLLLLGTIHNLSKCGTCQFRITCLRGCLGSQFENTGEILQPVDSVCRMLKAKLMFLQLKYEKMGLYETAKKMRANHSLYLLNLLKKQNDYLKNGEKELWNYWEPRMQKIILSSN